MKKQHIAYIVCMTALLSGCHIYKPYSRPEVDTKGLYRDPVSATDTLASDTANMGNLPWEQVFTDPMLQALIRQGLAENTDLQKAALVVKEAEAGLLSARLAYTPSLNLAPNGGVSWSELSPGRRRTWTWTAPVAASWEIDIFGRVLNAKRGAKATLLQSKAYKQAVQTQLVSAIANYYYTLLMLDKQLSITEGTSALWKKMVATMRDLKEAGYVNEAAIVQSEANSYMVEASIPDLERQIRETENALSVLLKQAPQRIARGTLEGQTFPEMMNAGVPVQLLANRPDVQAAEMALANAYYNTNVARAAFYPQLSITGTFGWTNSLGSAVVNPGKMIANAVGNLTAPIFNRGGNLARLRVAKAQQQEAQLDFEQSLLAAGSEVSNALFSYRSAQDKAVQRERQIASLEKSVEYTELLITHGTTTYLEVLTAQQSLLSARLSGVNDEFQQIQAVVSLYRALGGGRTE